MRLIPHMRVQCLNVDHQRGDKYHEVDHIIGALAVGKIAMTS